MNWKPGVHLVATVGGATKAVENAIRMNRPQYLYFLVSEQSSKNVEVILEATGHPDREALKVMVEPYDPTDIFEKTLELFRQLQAKQPPVLLLDITSGTTAMSVGAAFAASRQSIQVTYIQEMVNGEGLLHYLPLPK